MRQLYKLVCLLSISAILFASFVTHAESPHNGPMPVNEAFNLQAQIIDNELELYWQIANGYHLYQDQIKILNEHNVELVNPSNLPKGVEDDDPVLGKTVVYDHTLIIKIPKNEQLTNELLVHYQGCAETGFCYEPINKSLVIDNNKVIITDTTLEEFETLSSVDSLVSEIKNAYLPFTLAIFFGLGFLIAFSPCVLPMIPLVVNLIVGPEKISNRKSFLLSFVYVLGMAGSYALAGTLVGILGAKFQAWTQQPVVLVVFSSILILMALSQLELIRIGVPTFNRKLHHWGQKQLQGSLAGAFILGIISTLIVSPCVTPPLIGVLTYIGQNGNPLIGGLTLFCLGLGMGTPLIIVAMLSSVILPKAGRWMNLIKIGTAVALLGLAIWILQRIIDTKLTLVLWAGLCVIFALYLRKGDRLLKFFALILAIVAATFIAISCVKQYRTYHTQNTTVSPWQTIQSANELENLLTKAKLMNKYTIVEVYASWCVSCKKLELGVLKNPKVQEELNKFELIKIDITNVSDAENQLLDSLNIYGPPAILIFAPDGTEIEAKRLVGNVSTDDVLKAISF